MNGDTAMPVIEFADGTDYESLYTVLGLVNKGLGLDKGDGITWKFVLNNGEEYVGTYLNTEYESDEIVIALHKNGYWNSATATIKTDDIVRVVYQ